MKTSAQVIQDAKAGRRIDRIMIVGILLTLIAIWEGTVRGFGISTLIFPPASEVALALMRGLSSGLYWEHLGVTVVQMLVGFLIGASLGFTLGALISEFGRLGRLLFPYLVGLQSLPKVAVAPLIVMWFGFGMESKIVVVVLITFFPVLINTISGLSIVDSARIDLMRIMQATRWQTFAYVRLPSAAPTIFAGLHVAIVLALIGSIVGEFVGAQRGLGMLMLQAQASFDTSGMFVILIILACIGVTANLSMRWIERRVVYWEKRRGLHQ